jgi:hypothetical protein
MVCGIFFGWMFLALPEKWRDAILEAAFPFLPPRDRFPE